MGTFESVRTRRRYRGRRRASLSDLEERLGSIIARRTRFGGLQLKSGSWRFDVWPLSETWAFKKDRTVSVDFADLPSTTTF